MSTRIPTYPLITIDPFVSVWAKSDKINEKSTYNWTGKKFIFNGYLYVDDKKYLFLGKDTSCDKIEQVDFKNNFLNSVYTFENAEVKFTMDCWSTFFLDDLELMSAPASYLSFVVKSKDGKKHQISIEVFMDKSNCYNFKPKNVCTESLFIEGKNVIEIGQKVQKPLNSTGDGVNIDWGKFYLAGDNTKFNGDGALAEINGEITSKQSFVNSIVFAYDDIYSIEYLGKKLKGFWTKKYETIDKVIADFIKNIDTYKAKRDEWNKKLTKDASVYDKNYLKILQTSFRQVIAAHKLVEKDGKLLYMSKECHSNGCINTVDVTYPSIPLFLIYQPELVAGMLNGMFEFSRTNCWKYDFAPHDLGRYPIANGQVYGLNKFTDFLYKWNNSRKLFKSKKEIFYYNMQMPVEECGNFLITSLAYSKLSKNTKMIEDNFDLLEKWANYLVEKGVILENQLCTDDFAGHSEKNVNLAIKSVLGIKSFAEILKLLKKKGTQDYAKIAKENAKTIMNETKQEDYLNFCFDKKDTWSIKYNIVWDKIFKFNLFDKSIYQGEVKKYLKEINQYGLPLDYRSEFCKSDWMMWVSALDSENDVTNKFAKHLTDFLEETNDRSCFTDYLYTKTAKQKSMDHRSVQGGLWMPLLINKLK